MDTSFFGHSLKNFSDFFLQELLKWPILSLFQWPQQFEWRNQNKYKTFTNKSKLRTKKDLDTSVGGLGNLFYNRNQYIFWVRIALTHLENAFRLVCENFIANKLHVFCKIDILLTQVYLGQRDVAYILCFPQCKWIMIFSSGTAYCSSNGFFLKIKPNKASTFHFGTLLSALRWIGRSNLFSTSPDSISIFWIEYVETSLRIESDI